MKMMKRYGAALTAIGLLVACGGSGACVGGPAEVRHAGLKYDVCTTRVSFVGLPQSAATAIPESGSAIYSGPMRADVDGTYRDGTFELDAHFGNDDIIASGEVDFQGAQGIDIVAFSQNVAMSGNRFSNTGTLTGSSDVRISGRFYGATANVVAGTVDVPLGGGQSMYGRFIASQD